MRRPGCKPRRIGGGHTRGGTMKRLKLTIFPKTENRKFFLKIYHKPLFEVELGTPWGAVYLWQWTA